ncbi:MAG TPA: hypothetical protein VGK17_17160 [Propionicimonas sp.]
MVMLMADTAQPNGIFFAYPSHPQLRAETMRDTITRLGRLEVPAEGWQDLPIDGHLLIGQICAAIDRCAAVVAEVSSMNSNVLFEAGYAMARNKQVWLLLDETDTTALKNWSALSLLSTVGRTDYSGNAKGLASRLAQRRPDLERATLFDTLLAGGAARDAITIFAHSLPTKFTAATALERMLERQHDFTVRGASDDLGLAPLDFYVKEIYRSSAAIFHLLAPHRVRADEHNARASLLAGIAHGLDLPFLLVVESGFESPLDYRDKLYVYTSAAALQDYVRQWLSQLPKADEGAKRPGRLSLRIELPIRTFGQYVAEYEVSDLGEYFVQTGEFESILDGSAKVFIGRKGTGKTATMTQAVAALREDRRNLVVPIKPSSYELSGLIEAVSRFKNESSSQYFILTLWSYLITTEVALRVVSHARSLPAGLPEGTPQRQVELELENLGVAGDDLSIRLERAVDAVLAAEPDVGESEQQYIARRLRAPRVTRLQRLVGDATRGYDRVAVLIDNLDKAWERGADYGTMSRFILGLLTASGKLEKDFAKGAGADRAPMFSLAIFLRTDIFDVITADAREPDKIGALSVHWRDQELLARVLEERYAANQKSKAGSAASMWDELFVPEIRGLPARDYVLWRILPRPRDLIYFANAALTTAVNRQHSRIYEGDMLFAETQYSQFATEALLVESEAQGFDLEEILFEFAGLDSTLEVDALHEVLGLTNRSEDIIQWLVRTSFLGVEVDDGAFVHVEGAAEARRKLRLARRLSERLNRPRRYRVHPAFRNHLDVRDDDLHSPFISDQTLTVPSAGRLRAGESGPGAR